MAEKCPYAFRKRGKEIYSVYILTCKATGMAVTTIARACRTGKTAGNKNFVYIGGNNDGGTVSVCVS